MFPTIPNSDILSNDTVRCSVDLLHSTMSFDIEQPLVDGRTFKMIRSLCNGKNDIELHCLGGGSPTAYTVIRFEGCQITSHRIDVDYSKVGVATHILTASFGKCDAFNPAQ